MTINVDTTQGPITHHLSLTDGTDVLGLILWGKGADGKTPGPDPRAIRQSSYPRLSTQISQGRSGWSATEMPFSPQVQEDWSGGRGNEDFDKDSTKFSDSYRADTTRGDIICGPASIDTIVSFSSTQATGADTASQQLLSDHPMASPFTPGSNYLLRSVTVKINTTVPNTIRAYVYSDSSGPNTLLAQGLATVGILGQTVTVQVPITYQMTSGTKYWIAISASNDTTTIRVLSRTGDPIYVKSSSTWDATYANQSIWYSLSNIGPDVFLFFEYRGQLYAVAKSDDYSAPRLLQNGYRGFATSNTGSRHRLKTTLTLAADELVGCYAKIIAGPGYDEETNWRKITANTAGANSQITVTPNWNIDHTTATEFVILGCNTWTEIAGHGLTKPATDVCVVNDIVYFAQGGGVPIRRGRIDAGTWQWDEDAGLADFLAIIPDTSGKYKLWMANAAQAKVYFAETQAWGTDLTWKTLTPDAPCGNSGSKITGIEAYSSPLIPYVMKEDGFGSISGTDDKYVYAEHPLSAQLKNVRSENNGRAHMRYDLFLKFSLLDGLESHYDQRLDDVGPNRDEGLPANRRGPVYHLVAYAGRYYAAVDGGASGYSSVLCCTRDGSWHEVYRGALGKRIRRLFIQTIPGTFSRLWISEDEKLCWIPLTIDPRKHNDYLYFSGSQVVTSWIYCGFRDINKYFHELTIFAEGLTAGAQFITVDYQVDNQTSWTALPNFFVTSPAQTVRMSASNNVAGRRIRLRFTLYTDNPLLTPRIKAYRLDAIVRLKPKKMWSVTYMVKDLQRDLRSSDDVQNTTGDPFPEYILSMLDRWADSEQSPCPLIMRHNRKLYDNKLVIVEPSSISPLSMITTPNGEAVFVGQFTLLEA